MVGTRRHQRRNHRGIEHLPGLRVAEKLGHPDQQIAKQGVNLQRIALEQGHIVVAAQNGAQAHAPLDPAQQGAALVARKIITTAGLHQLDQLLRGALVVALQIGLGITQDIGVAGIGGDHLGHFGHGQHMVGAAGGNGAARHAVAAGAGRVLHQHHAAMASNRPHAQSAVRTRTRQHHANATRAAVIGHRVEAQVNRQPKPTAFDTRA